MTKLTPEQLAEIAEVTMAAPALLDHIKALEEENSKKDGIIWLMNKDLKENSDHIKALEEKNARYKEAIETTKEWLTENIGIPWVINMLDKALKGANEQ